jgi:hypothetical protein
MDGLATAEFLMEVDQLFDSMNASQKEWDKSKELKKAVTHDSPHLQFWTEMEKKVKSWEFLRKRKIHPPSQDGWLASIRGMRMLWKKLDEDGFLHMNSQNFNQDPLENFFNVVRQNCGGNHFPNARQFHSAFITALLNNLVSNHTPGNTREDGCSMLGNISSFFSPEGENAVFMTQCAGREKHVIRLPDSTVVSVHKVSAHFVHCFLKKYSCIECQHLLFEEMSAMPDIYFSFFVEGLGSDKVCPSDKLISVVQLIVDVVSSLLEKEGHRKNLMTILRPLVEQAVDVCDLSCGNHMAAFKNEFLNYMLHIGIRKFCIEESKKIFSFRH